MDEVAELTVYQRSANWCTPLNNSPITAAEQRRLRAGFEELRDLLAISVSGFAHPVNTRSAFDDPPAARRAFYERMWASPGFLKLTGNCADLLLDPAVNDEWCRFIAGKIRGIVADPEERWTRMVERGAARTTFGTIGQYVGENIPGKPRRYLLNAGGRPKLLEIMADVVKHGYQGFELTAAGGDGSRPRVITWAAGHRRPVRPARRRGSRRGSP